MEKKDIIDIGNSVEDQIADLRGKIADLSKQLSQKANAAAANANVAVDKARGNVGNAVQTVRDQGQDVVKTVRENPGTATSVALSAGLVGLAIGYLVGSSSSDSTSRWHR
jgi:ElaB/YqjD/DUF883 family membrane-anchored ribosome-binding protein